MIGSFHVVATADYSEAPPQTTRFWPVIAAASSDSRKAATPCAALAPFN
jgi:hypothetical protein